MKSTFVSKEGNIAAFTMEFSAEEFEQAIIKAYQEGKGKFEIDGFRKGKAPRSIIEKHYGEDVFFDDAVSSLVSDAYPVALDELKLEVIDRPDAEFSDIKKGEGFTATIKVEIYPEIVVKDYTGVKVGKIENTVSDEDVDMEMEKLLKKSARMVPVERPIENGDTALIDYAGFVGDDQFEGGTAERYLLKIGSGSFIPGFEEQLIGAKEGDDVEVKVTFPEEYHSADLAGKDAVFKCKVHEVKEEEIPELDDEFVKDVSECDTVDELKVKTKEDLQKIADAKAEMEMKNKAIDAVVEANEFDVPAALIEEEIDQMMREFDQQLQQQGLNLQSYFQYLQKDPQEFRGELREDAKKRITNKMVIRAITEQEKIEVAAEDIDKEIEFMAEQYKMEADKIREMLGEENISYIENDLKFRKAVELVYEKAVIK